MLLEGAPDVHGLRRRIEAAGPNLVIAAGGDGTAHSNVSPPHGLGPAASPRRRLRTTFQTNSPMPGTMMNTPMVEIRFQMPHPTSAS